MKKVLGLFLAIVLCISVSGCNDTGGIHLDDEVSDNEVSSSTNGTESNKSIPRIVQMQSTGEIDFNNIKYKKVIDDRFVDFASPIKNDGLFSFEYNDSCGYCDETGKVVINNQFYSVEPFAGEYAIVATEEKADMGIRPIYHVIDKTGKMLSNIPKLTKGSYDFDGNSYYHNEKFVFGKNSLDGTYSICVISSDMKFSEKTITDCSVDGYQPVFINEPEFSGILISEGTENRFRVFNTQGTEVYSVKKDVLENSVENAFGIDDGATFGACYDYGGNGIFFFKNGYANVMNDSGKWGLMQLSDGKMVIGYSYDYLGAYSDGVIPVCNYGKWGVINMNGETMIPCSYQYIGSFTNDCAFAVDANGAYCTIDKKGNVVATFSDINNFGNEFYVSPFTDKGIAVLVDRFENSYIISNAGDVLLFVGEDELVHFSENFIGANGNLYKIVVDNE